MGELLKAVIFDLDGVITDTAEYHYLAWKTIANELDISFSREFNEDLKGISRTDSLEKILLLSGKERDFTLEQKLTLTEKKNAHYCRLIEGITPADILPGIKELILSIKLKGLKLGLASVSKNALTVLNRLELTQYFDTVVDAQAIQRGKPNPEIFLTAAKQLDVEPLACLGIEDAIAGIEAIKDAGMFAVGIGNQDTLAKADLVYASTAKLTLAEISSEYNKNLEHSS
ncbi:MAG: beta-phosphoglucomutase [Bacillus sp. (in: Bacteria)]|nr:beta-phosphoglucomutase [Bacillus sp. (in: firmicutes)]